MTVTQLSDDIDALSDVLHTIRLRADNVRRTAADRTAALAEVSGTRAIYVVERGRLRINLPHESRTVNEGGIALVARGFDHTLRPDVDTIWVTGTFSVDEQIAEPVLRVLPGAITIEAGERTEPWLDAALALIVSELTHPQPGGRVMASRLLDLLFIRTLRDWAATDSGAVGGWLPATMDVPIARALTAIHRAPGHPWTVDELAQTARLSRSAFAARFTTLVGESPGRYVTQQRLAKAGQLLNSSEMSIRRIAANVGYESEAAFSRAFSQAFGHAPRTHRQGRT